MSQYARPNSDSSVGSWSPAVGATLYGEIDETTYNDTDCITARSSTCKIGLSTVTDPVSSSGHIIRGRGTYIGLARATATLTVYLYEGITMITSFIPTLVRNTVTDFTYTLSSTEANNITDYSNLFLSFNAVTSAAILAISWAEFEVPDAAAPPTVRRIFVV